MVKLDDNDLKILRLLQENGRIPYAEISKKLNIPESTIRFRVNKLVREGVITKFTAILDPRKCGYDVTVWF